jgi:glycosyltransferase involved in cell wall biosynthesis
LFAEERIDVIHAHQYTPFAYAVATRAFGCRPPVLFTEHGRFYPDYPNFKRKVFNRLLPDRRDRFIAVGESVRQALIRNEGLPPRRVEIVYNGVDLSAFDHDQSRDDVRHELGVASDTFLVVQVARLDTIKDHTTAVRAIAAAVEQCPAIRLMIVGDGPERDVIVETIKALGLEKNVTMLGLRHDVSRILSAADAFLLTSLSEGIPVTIIEAMAAGVPVVSTNVGGVPELLEDGVSGLLVPVGDATGVANALTRLEADRDLRERLSRAARERAETCFSEPQMIEAYAALYASMPVVRPVATSSKLSTRH